MESLSSTCEYIPYVPLFLQFSFHYSTVLGEVLLYNIFYEVFTVCTSIVAEDSSGNIMQLLDRYHELIFGAMYLI